MRFWGAKIVASSCTHLGPAQVMKVIIIGLWDFSHAHLWVFTSNNGTVKMAKTGFNGKIVKFTITGPLIWCDNPQVHMSKILNINNNNFHHLGRSQMCAGGCYVFRTSKPHSGTLWLQTKAIRRFVITEKAPTRAFSWFKAAHSVPECGFEVLKT